jgi:hypothetical protein
MLWFVLVSFGLGLVALVVLLIAALIDNCVNYRGRLGRTTGDDGASPSDT